MGSPGRQLYRLRYGCGTAEYPQRANGQCKRYDDGWRYIAANSGQARVTREAPVGHALPSAFEIFIWRLYFLRGAIRSKSLGSTAAYGLTCNASATASSIVSACPAV